MREVERDEQERSTDDPDAPPTEAELAAAERLRRGLELEGEALAEASPEAEAARWARALRHAHSPSPIDPALHAALVEQAMPRAKVRRLPAAFWGAPLALAAAAAAALFVSRGAVEAPRLRPSRPLDALFAEPFPRSGATSARIDRVVAARGRDLRDNRFAKLGVR
jgi:hypothetical protein